MPTRSLRTFCRDEDGAVTVDWVVLSAAIIGLGVLVVAATRSGTLGVGTATANSLSGTADTILTYDSNNGSASPIGSGG